MMAKLIRLKHAYLVLNYYLSLVLMLLVMDRIINVENRFCGFFFACGNGDTF